LPNFVEDNDEIVTKGVRPWVAVEGLLQEVARRGSDA
jgi:hypothetical protein